MEILAFIITVIVGIFTEGLAVKLNMAGLGSIVAIALMGSIILWAVRHKK